MTSTLIATQVDDMTRGLAAELIARVPGAVGARQVHEQVRAALADLRGSVSPESLPEMAVRLACHRITQIDDPV
jgi:hypothetical protein